MVTATDWQRVMAIKSRYEADLMRKANVVGVGVGFRQVGGRLTDELVLIVNVTRKVPTSQLAPGDIIPTSIEGVSTDVHEVGEVRAF